MSLASELIERLRRHYIKDATQPGGVFVPECGLNNSFGAQRRVDAVHIGFTGTSGQILRGHEVKVSRSDWLHELDQPNKATLWQNECHEWWLVTPTPTIVALGELPPGWGHMVPDPRTKVRFKVLVPAERKPSDHSPSWLVMRSIFAKLDTLDRGVRADAAAAIRQEAFAAAEAQFERRKQDGMSFEDRDKIRVYDELAQILGPEAETWRIRHDLVSAAKLAPFLDDLLGSRYGHTSLGAAGDVLARLAVTLKATQAEIERLTGGR